MWLNSDRAFNRCSSPFEQEAPGEAFTQHRGDENEEEIEESGTDGSDFSKTERTKETKRQYKKDNYRPHSKKGTKKIWWTKRSTYKTYKTLSVIRHPNRKARGKSKTKYL